MGENKWAIIEKLTPWLMLLGSIIYGFGSRDTATIHSQTQALDDHIAIKELTTRIDSQEVVITENTVQLKLIIEGRIRPKIK